MTVRRQLLMTLLGVADLALVLASFTVVSSTTRGGFALGGLLEQSLSLREILLLACYLLYWHIALASSGLYGSYRLAPATRELRNVAVAGVLAAAPLAPLAAMLGYPRVGGAFVACFWAVAVGSLALGRRLLRGIGMLVRRAGRNLREVVIVGEGTSALDAALDLAGRAGLGYRIAAVINVAGEGDTPETRARAALRRLEAVLDRQPIDEIFLAFPLDREQPVMAKMIWLCEEQGVLVRVLADLRVAAGAWAAADTLLGRPVVTIGNGPADLVLLAVKRGIDLLGACIGLIVLVPALAAIAVAIKLDSPGAVIFAQDRIGLNRRRFSAYKFRTMVPGAERLQAQAGDRATRRRARSSRSTTTRASPALGRWLRATSLDELPQLINVLKGEMSLVGPRPLPVRDVSVSTCAGTSGASASSRASPACGNSSSRAPKFDEWIRSDMEYIDNWSLALDLKILAKTLPAVLSRQNAV